MNENSKITFINNAGGCIASRRIIDGTGYLKWAVREPSVHSADNGWRFFSSADDAEYINNSSNLVICDFNTIATIEPAIIAIYLLPVGSITMNGPFSMMSGTTVGAGMP